LGRKFKRSMPRVMQRFRQQNTFGTRTARLLKPSACTAKWHHVRSIPNPYCAPQPCGDREAALCLEAAWQGTERQPGIADLREVVYARDGGICGRCGQPVPWNVYHMDHIKPRRAFRRPADAER
jgi:5-methylcytosine-specific restriction endonuclease McrA